MGSFITLDINSLTLILKTCHNCPTGNITQVNVGESLASRIRGDLGHNISFICCGLNINPEGAIFWHSEEINPDASGDTDVTDSNEQNEISIQETSSASGKVHRGEVKEVLVKSEKKGMIMGSIREPATGTVPVSFIVNEKYPLTEESIHGNVVEIRVADHEKDNDLDNRLPASNLKSYPMPYENNISEECCISDNEKNCNENSLQLNISENSKSNKSNKRSSYVTQILNEKNEYLPLVTVCKSLNLRGESKQSKYKKYPDSFTCEYCAKEFVGKDRAYQFYLHRNREHTQEMVYKCQVCCKTFWGDRELMAHEVTHKNPGHICHVCGQKFKAKKNLDAHMLTHFPEKPHSCKVCDKAFKRKDHLKLHERIHSGERPYQCEWCTSAYSQRVQLLFHVKKCPNRKYQEEQEVSNEIQIHI